MSVEPILEVTDLTKHYPARGRGMRSGGSSVIKAVDGVSLKLFPGETLGLVGESGCGKSTTGRALLRLTEPTSGTVTFEGENLLELGREELRRRRKDLQYVFQDPYASLDPRMTIGQTLTEPLLIHGVTSARERRTRINQLLDVVGLPVESALRYPHEFSGGQRQRIGIARALIVNPKVIVADEPVSALDVSIQAQIINLMQDLQREFGVSYIFISHDLSVVRHISDRISVMYLGRIVEQGPSDQVSADPLHPYAQALLSSVPMPDPTRHRERIVIEGDVPSPGNPPAGCTFHTRCPFVMDVCRSVRPPLVEVRPRREVACHLFTGATAPVSEVVAS